MVATSIRPLTAPLQKVAIEQLNEAPDRVAADIAVLKLWIEQQPHLRARTDDQFLLAFLRGCKFSLEKAKNKIDKFYTYKTKFPEFFCIQTFDMKRLLELIRMGSIFYLPTPLHDEGPRIGVLRLGALPADRYKVQENFQLGQLMQEIMLQEDDYANIYGVVHILDLENVSAAHFFQMTPALMKKTAVWSEEAIPLRHKATHFINTPSGFEAVFNMVKPMLSQKQQNRLYVHGNKMEALHREIPKKYLPKEYGGENGTINKICTEWECKISAYSEYFKQDGKYGTDEKLRPGKPIDFENIFGIDGSFRQLNVD